MPYCPLGNGFLAGKIDEDTQLDATDFRNTLPRFAPEARKANQGARYRERLEQLTGR